MRILVITQYFWPENFRINDLVAEFKNRGNDVIILTGYPNYPSGTLFPDYKSNPHNFTTYMGCKVVRVPIFCRGKGAFHLIINYVSYALSASIIGSLILRHEKIDLIFVFEPSPITVGIPAILLGYLKSCPIVLWVLDLWPESLEALGIIRSKILLKIIGSLVSYIYNHCNLILAQSRSFIPQIKKYSNKCNNIKYFPSWSDIDYPRESLAPAHEIESASDGIFTIMFTGNVGEAQDFPTIIKAAEIMKNDQTIRWVIVGDGRAMNWLKNEIRLRGLGKNFILLGQHPVHRMPSFIMHADVLLVSLKSNPVYAMTIPGKLQSYLHSGKPIIAMLDGEGANIVKEANAGFVCPAGDSAELAMTVKRLSLLSSDERKQLGNNGYLYSESEFNRNILITKLLAFFEQTLDNRL